jgi:hypothetical protein
LSLPFGDFLRRRAELGHRPVPLSSRQPEDEKCSAAPAMRRHIA